MFGWVIKRGLDGGRDAPEDPDDTRMEQPDTPGPVFAARAFKSAIFGTPARQDETVEIDNQPAAAARPVPREPAATTNKTTEAKPSAAAKDTGVTPGRLPGILLTPGTATSRRKRVSFGHEVPAEGADKKNELRIDRNGRRPNLFGDNSTRSKASRTTLGTALENARKQNNKAAAASKPVVDAAPVAASRPFADEPEDDWEEVDEDDRDPDITVDLNEPHSQSGRYWKSEFQRYQEDAKVEMGKLLKYKQLAKSYAKMKDAEAADMRTKLQEEKEKVTEMEGRITELAGQIARKRMDSSSDREYQELISDLTRQTARAVQYRNQVKELEAMLQNSEKEAAEPLSAFTTVTSPRTQRTLIDTQRELRRARDQARELTQAKEEIRRLKSALRAAEQKAEKAARKAEGSSSTVNSNKKLEADLAASEATVEALNAKVDDLEKRAEFAEDERRQKDKELRLVQRKYDSLKDDAKARVGEAEQVMRRKNEEIADLKKQIRQVTATAATVRQTVDDVPILVDDIKDFKDTKPVKELKQVKEVKEAKAKASRATDAPISESAAAKLAMLRCRRGAEPLRPVSDAQRPKAILESIGINRINTEKNDKGKEKEKPKAEPLGERIAKLGQTTRPYQSTVSTRASAPALVDLERDDRVAAAAAAAADASCLSMSSERAAAAIARIEARRAQRKLELETLRNKENMQPA